MIETLEKIDVSYIKTGAAALTEKRKMFTEFIYPTLVEGQDFFVTDDGRKVLSKGGAERLAEIYSITAEFFTDKESLAFIGSAEGIVAYRCVLKREGVILGEGRGSASLKDHDNSVNSTIKVAQKSAFVDGVLRVTGTSFLFSQDFLPKDKLKEPVADEQNLATEKQRAFLLQLINEKCSSQTREDYLSQLNSPELSRYMCSELISSLLPMK